MKYQELYDEKYFKLRQSNDPKRLQSFALEKELMLKHISQGKILDVGCSTGEFLLNIHWQGDMYGMEISEHATSIAKQNGIRFDKDLTNCENFFDVIVFRGTIQHVDQPFKYIELAHKALKANGKLIFLATPNTNSIYFKIWNTLPLLDPASNFYLPSDHNLIKICENLGFELLEIEYPYLTSPYANPVVDHLKFIQKLLLPNSSHIKFPFWKNLMNIAFQKKK